MFPIQKLCGRLIGKNGTFVNMLKARTGAHVIIRLHPVKSSVKICSVDGERPGVFGGGGGVALSRGRGEGGTECWSVGHVLWVEQSGADRISERKVHVIKYELPS